MTSDAKTRRLDCEPAVDRISALPRNLIDLILERVPVHDAARTSILSKTWRNVWGMHPNLVFDKIFFSQLLSERDKQARLSKALKTISKILFVRSSPILRFYISIPRDLPLNQCKYMDFWIKKISNNGVRNLELYCNKPLIAYKIPSYLFSCLELTHLSLTNCILNPPLIFGGLCNLIYVKLGDVIITADMSFGTRLEELYLFGCTGIEHLGCQFKYNNNLSNFFIVDSGEIDWRWFECTKKVKRFGLGSPNSQKAFLGLDKLLGNMPLICSLCLDSFYLQHLEPALWNLEPKMENLNNLVLHRVGFNNSGQIECVLSLIRSSPNLRYLSIKQVRTFHKVDVEEVLAVQYPQSPSLIDQLETVGIRGVMGSRAELHFIKFLLASCPSLRWMKLSKNTTIDDPEEELRILGELLQLPRASAVAQIIWINSY